ncbi:glycosyltransferase family 1 protein [Polaribacter sp. IC066]|uniref:glycosyltransferase n=1 Tax=Polaribacter sp. IC066 TaxID=57032 RepID=UPI0011BD807B|nr:glycosyltransferase [Polaribacter sp. IC066]TXD56691.1 glycosyltransferase family 1 protein [Polaribacter sp. IC066]
MINRILHITGSMNRAGAETMLMNLYRTIDRSKIQFDFVCFTAEKVDYEDEIYQLGGSIHRILVRNPIKRMFALKKLLKKHPEYKSIHSHTLLSSGFNLWAAKLAHVKTRIAHAHSTNDISNVSFVGKLYKYVSLKLIHKYATQRIACGKEAAVFLFKKQDEVLFLPNSIDTYSFAEMGETQKEYINTEFNIDNKVLKIIQVGRLQPVKNHEFSITLANTLKEKGIPFKMFFVGQGELYKNIESQINEQDLMNDVLLLGLRTDISELMSGADLLLMPSLHEGFPVVLVESQAVGLPALIATTISPEVDLGVGLIEFEPLSSDTATWVERLLRLKSKEKITKNERLEKIAEQGFDIQSSTILLTNLYNTMY